MNFHKYGRFFRIVSLGFFTAVIIAFSLSFFPNAITVRAEGPGCTDPGAENYNPDATEDDGSCMYPPVLGCMDPMADNYDWFATQDDGSCVIDPTELVLSRNEINEGDPIGSQIGTLSTDGDAGGTLSMCPGSGVDNSHFYIYGNEKLLSLESFDFDNPVDANSDNDYEICIRTVTGGLGTIFDTNFTIHVLSVDETVRDYTWTRRLVTYIDPDPAHIDTLSNWTEVAISGDGMKLFTAPYSGKIYYSDFGAGFGFGFPPSAIWSSIASSYDGSKLVGAPDNNNIYTSTDGGANWTEQTNSGSRNWMSAASSYDGTHLVAGVNGGYIYTSTDSGANWTERTGAGSRVWRSVASSDDGTKLVAVNGSPDSYIYTSTDSGANWTERTGAGARNWSSVASSSDGTKLVSVAEGTGYIYTSTDSGANWTERTGAGSQYWSSVASSADGTILAAAPYKESVSDAGGNIYTSNDSGSTWDQQSIPGWRWWNSISLSADGARLVAASSSGSVWTGEASVVTTHSVTYSAGANGSLAGSTSQTINDGDDGTAVTAVPDAGYHFVDWSDTVTDNPRTDTNVTGDISVTANFAADAPNATNLSAPETYTEDTTLNLVDIVVSDIDSADVTVTLTLSDPSAGTLSTATSGAVTSTYDTNTGVWTASGAITDVNTLLAGLTFIPVEDGNSSFTIITSVSDGVTAAVTGGKVVTGIAVNDAPMATNLSAAESYTEDTALNLVDIVVSDVDSASITVTLTLSNTSAGTLSTATSGAVTSTFIGGVWTASGAIASINTLLAGVIFTPAADFNSSFTIATSVSDGIASAITGTKVVTGIAVDEPTYSVTYSAGANGSLTGSTSQTVSDGSDATAVTAVPDSGYYFVNWTGTGTSTDNPLILTNVTGDISVTANFAADILPTPTPVSSRISGGRVSVIVSTLCPANLMLTQNLKSGSRNGVYNSYTKAIVTEAKNLQAQLNRLGFNAGPVDGILGRISDGAIRRMQVFLGTKADGYVGPLTRALLNNSCGKGL